MKPFSKEDISIDASIIAIVKSLEEYQVYMMIIKIT